MHQLGKEKDLPFSWEESSQEGRRRRRRALKGGSEEAELLHGF